MKITNTSIFQWHSLASAEDVATEVFDQIKRLSEQAIKNNGQFKLVLAGGTTPAVVYKKLLSLATDWSKWYIFFGDERCLESNDPQRNSKMAQDNWLDQVLIPKQNIHVIEAQLGAEKAAELYQPIIEKSLPFDLVLNGMGEDGHTASLFPGQTMVHQTMDHQKLVVAVYHSPKPPSDRVSLSLKALATTQHSFIVITGATKYQALSLWQQGESFPVNQLKSLNQVDVFVDQGALTGK